MTSILESSRRINFLTFNIRCLKQKLKMLEVMLSRLNIHLLFLQEHYYKNDEVAGYTVLQKNRSQAVVILIRMIY